MEVVTQQEPLSMGWCLSCHRNPEPFLRDPRDPSLVTNLGWVFEGSTDELEALQRDLRQHNAIQPSEDCSTCHR
jgi:hypothetical protein